MADSFKVWVNRFRFRLSQPHVVLGILLVLLLAVLVILPFVQMVHDTAVWQEADTRISREARPGEWTAFHYLRVFSSRLSKVIFYRPLLHSLETSLAISFLMALTLDNGVGPQKKDVKTVEPIEAR